MVLTGNIYRAGDFKTIRTAHADAKEVLDRLKYFYGKTNGSYEWDTPHECQLLPIVLEMCLKMTDDALHENTGVKNGD